MSTLINKILAPTDFTKNADASLETAAGLAKAFKAELLLLHVVELPSYGGMFFDSGLESPNEMEIEFARDQLKQLQSEERFSGIEVKLNVRTGKIFQSIIEEAEEQSADLIVMGAHGLSGLEKMVLGTNAKRVIHLTPVPVLTVKEPLNISSIENIAFASSFNEEYGFSFPQIHQYMELFDAKINLVKVITPKDFESTAYSRKTIDDFAASLNLKMYELHTLNAYSIEEGLTWFCNQQKIDLLFMLTHGHGGFYRTWSGSHTETMGQEHSVPVFSLKMIQLAKPKGVIFPD